MPNFAVLLKDEIRRLARKEIKESFGKIKQEASVLRRSVASLKRRLAQLETENRRLKREAGLRSKEDVDAVAGSPVRARFTGKAILRLRLKLRLTQAQFAKLVGVSTQSVYQWERRQDRLQLRSATKTALVEARTLGTREARRRIEEMRG